MCCLWIPLKRRCKKEPKAKKKRDASVGEHESFNHSIQGKKKGTRKTKIRQWENTKKKKRKEKKPALQSRKGTARRPFS